MEVAKCGKRIILSSGMSTIDEIKDAMNVLYSEGVEKKTFLFYIVIQTTLQNIQTLTYWQLSIFQT